MKIINITKSESQKKTIRGKKIVTTVNDSGHKYLSINL